VISLSDGRICYVDTVQASHDFSPERSVAAVAEIRGRLRFELELPASWEAMQEAELRSHVERGMQARLASIATPAPAAAPATAPAAVAPPQPARGFLARLLDLSLLRGATGSA
jgi:hypothetical protein